MEPLSLIVGSLLGAFLSLLCTVGYEKIKKAIHRIDPLRIEFIRSETPPLWFATNCPPPIDLSDAYHYEHQIMKTAPFCGFAKINLRITNKADDVLYITDINIKKEQTDCNYKFRVRTIPQGDCPVIRFAAYLDDEYCYLTSNLRDRKSIRGNYFECSNRIKIAPGETDIVFLSFVTINHAYKFNCDLVYSINGKNRCMESIFGEDQIIVPYIPSSFESDFCAFLEHDNPGYQKFDDAKFFTKDMRSADTDTINRNILSSLDYLARKID